MRYVLISDIHANLPALRSVYAHVTARSDIDAIYHLGDLVGYAPWPNEVVDFIATHGIAGVAGNYDSTVGTGYKHCGCRYENPRQEELSHVSYTWTRRHVSPKTRTFLAALPFRVDLLPRGGHQAGRGGRERRDPLCAADLAALRLQVGLGQFHLRQDA